MPSKIEIISGQGGLPACPNCKCYTVRTPKAEGHYTVRYGECYDLEGTWRLRYVEVEMVANQVRYICCVEGSITAPVDSIITPTGSDCYLNNECVVPEAYCYTITLTSGFSALFEYMVPLDGIGQFNVVQNASVSSMIDGGVITVCARQGSIVQTGGGGTFSISSPGFVCETTPICNTACICVTLTNTESPLDPYTVYYNYRSCVDGQYVGEQSLLNPGDSVSFCMLENSLIIPDQQSLYSLTINGPCPDKTTCVPPAFQQRCIFNFPQIIPPNVPQMMEDFNWREPIDYDTFTLLDFTVNGTQYASSQFLQVDQGANPVVYGLGQDGLMYPMNVVDWLNAIGCPDITFYDNMRVIDTLSTTTYTIHIHKDGTGGGREYYFTSQYGFGITTPTGVYGIRSCAPYNP